MRRCPKVFEKEAMAIFDQYLEDTPDEETEELDLTAEEEDALLKEHYRHWEAYLLEHASSLLREWYVYYNSRCGDESELYDYDGTYLIGESGYPIQRWDISDDHRIVDETGKQIYYSNGEPILAKKMSTELFEYLKQYGWLDEDATEEAMWY
ncbi:MAG: hypothetical protein IKU70_08035 [Clostridia bacterium]|nr:hypothetical protein [Clostridia bacterium]